MSVVVGIDLSSYGVDLVRLDETAAQAEHVHVKLEGGSSWDRTRRLPRLMPRASWWDDVYLCAVERPFGASRRGQAVLMRVQGAILSCIPTPLEVWEVSPAEWKQPLRLGNRKPEHTAFPEFDVAHWTQDALDALGVALYARDLNATGVAA